MEKEERAIMVTSDTHAACLWYVSWLSFASAIVGFMKCKSEIAIVPMAVCFTSLNYWRKPRYGSWERKLDLAVVIVGLSYQSYRALLYENAESYFTVLAVALSCYPISLWAARNNLNKTATALHIALHILANGSNLVLYCGIKLLRVK